MKIACKKKRAAAMLLSLGLVCALVFCDVRLAFAATARATTMRLEKTEGTVSVKSLNGTTKKNKTGMRLFNGDSVKTSAKSAAYISLDSSKAVKLAENSQAALNQRGKKLELMVKSGNLFFNVSKPLASNESMNIRTSTMVTGVRGTCGVIETYPTRSILYLLEGSVTYTVTDSTTGERITVQVKGGEKMTMERTGGELTQNVEKLEATEIPVFALEEVAADTELQKKIEDTTDLNVQTMIEYYESQTKEPDSPASQTQTGTENTSGNTASDQSNAANESVTESTGSSGSSSSGSYNGGSGSGGSSSSSSSNVSPGAGGNSDSNKDTDTGESGNTDQENTDSATSGKAGENVTWETDEHEQDKVLIISGSGMMYNYEVGEDGKSTAPWSNLEIVSVMFGNGVTNVGNNAFYNCTTLHGAALPEGVTNIGEGAFYNCSNLHYAELPNSLTGIGKMAYYNCSSLGSVRIPGSVIEIGEMAFSNCTGLNQVVVDGNEDYSSGADSSSGASTLSRSEVSIKDKAFYGCSNLSEVMIKTYVKEIGADVFGGCSDSLVITCSADNNLMQNYASTHGIEYKVEQFPND